MESSRTINVNTLSTDNIILRKAYAGNFDICGSLVVNTNVYVDKDFYESGNSYMKNITANTLLINDGTDFYGPVFFHSDFHARNDILTQQSIASQQSITVGTQLYFNNGVNGSTNAAYNYMFGNISGIGVNRIDPVATLDISSANVYALNVVGHQPVNTNILAKNIGGNGIVLSADVDNSIVGFYVNAAIDLTRLPDAYIRSNRSGTMQLATGSDVLLQGNLIVSGQNHTNIAHRHSESAVIYDSNLSASTSYFGNIYLDPTSSSACALSLVSNITDVAKRASTFMYMTSQNDFGTGIGGGQYPNADGRAMSVRGLIDASAVNLFTPFETVVSSNNLDKYLATVGINTYTPRTETCILDVNGPVHIDNGDINSVISMGFQVKYLNQAIKPSASNFIMAVGTSIDISGSFQLVINGTSFNAYRHPIYFSSNSGKTWRTVTIYPSNDINPTTLEPIPNAVLKGDFLNQVATYDASYAFITGNNNTLIYTYNGGFDWQDIIVLGIGTAPLNFTGLNIAAVQNNTTHIVDTVSIYLSAGNKFATFDVSLNQLYDRPIGNTLSVTTTLRNAPMTSIQSIAVSSKSCKSAYTNIYLAGDNIAVYSKTNLTTPTFIFTNANGLHNCTYMHAYDDNHAIAVGPETIVSTQNGGTTWTLASFTGSTINDVSIFDQHNAIAVGDGGIVLITTDGGVTWSKITASSPYYNWFNSSGKANLLLNSDANLRDIVIPDPNTFLISNCTVDYVDSSPSGGVYGQSNIYSCFFPNYLNYRNNNVLDICGNMNLYGDMTIHSRDGYNFIETDLSCTSFSFINSSVLDLSMAMSAQSITIGNSNTEVIIPGIITTQILNYIDVNTVEIVCDHYTSISNSMLVSNSGTIHLASNAIMIGENLSQNNTIQIGNAGGSNATISVGGPTDAINVNAPLISSQPITVNNNIVVSGTLSQFNGINNTGTITSTNLSVTNDATVSKNLQVNGNITANQNITVYGNTFIKGPLVVQNTKGTIQTTAGSLNTGMGNTILLGCSGTNNTAIGTNLFSPSSSYGIANYGYNGGVVSGAFNIGIGDNIMTQNAMTGNYNTGIGQHSLFANNSGSNNNAIGNRSLTSITTGNYNVGVGDYSLGSSQTGTYNTAVGGYNVLKSLGSDNVHDGSYNTAIGTESMWNVLGGNYNTAVGALSGQNGDNYVASNCTFLGANAIANTGGGVGSTITNSTAIGYGATVTMDHQIVLGTASETVYIPSTSGVGIAKIAANGYALDINGTARSTGGFIQTSDYRIKDDVLEFPTGFSVDHLRPVYYRNTLTDEYEMGFLAHEVQSSFPFLVQGEKDGEDYQSMKYSGLIALLVKEIQDLKRQLREL